MKETQAYILACDVLEQTIKDDSFRSPFLETRPHLSYYRGNIEKISRALIKHVLENHLMNSLRYWPIYRLRRMCGRVEFARGCGLENAGCCSFRAGNRPGAGTLRRKELRANQEESRPLNELCQEEKKVICRQTDEVVGLLKKRFAF